MLCCRDASSESMQSGSAGEAKMRHKPEYLQFVERWLRVKIRAG